MTDGTKPNDRPVSILDMPTLKRVMRAIKIRQELRKRKEDRQQEHHASERQKKEKEEKKETMRKQKKKKKKRIKKKLLKTRMVQVQGLRKNHEGNNNVPLSCSGPGPSFLQEFYPK